MAEIGNYGQLQLSFRASETEATSYPNHKYFYRFSGVIENERLASNTNYTIKIFSNISDGTLTTSFKTGNIEQASTPSAPTNCVVHVDSPSGQYSGYKNIEITGWIASNTSPGYIMAEIDGYGQMNLSFSDSPSEAGAQPNYAYFKRFRGVIDVDRLASYTTYNFRVFSDVQNSPYQSTFSTANVEPITYAVSFNANGGANAPSGFVVTQGKSGTIPNTVPVRYGYNFLGWSTSSSSTTVRYTPGSSISPSSNTTLYAVWSAPIQYALQFDANGGKNAPASTSIAYGSSGIIPYTVPEKFPNTFVGWSEESEDVTPSYRPGDNISLTYDTKLYAIWESPIEFRTTLPTSVNGDVNACGTVRYFKFTPQITNSYTLESKASSGDPMGYLYDSQGNELLFNDDGGEGSNFSLSYNLTAGKTYYYAVRWFGSSATGTIPVVLNSNETIFTITYDANGGSGAPNPQYKSKDETIVLSSTIPLRFGYTFAGWAFPGFDTATHMPGQRYSGTADLALSAVWEEAETISSSLPSAAVADISVEGTIRYFKFTPNTTDTYVFESTASSGDPMGYLYTSSGSILASNDDSNGSNFSIAYNLTAGRTYYFATKWYNPSLTGKIPVKVSVYTEPVLTYTVTYDYSTNGGTSADKTSEVVESGSMANLAVSARKTSLSLGNDTTAPWEFVGWNTNPNATTGLLLCKVNSDITLYAIFKQNIVASFYAGENSELQTTEKITIYNNATSGKIILPSATTYSGWTFVSWQRYEMISSIFGETVYDHHAQTSYNLGADTEFYAVYNRNLSLSYDSAGGYNTPSTQKQTQYMYSRSGKEDIEFTVAQAPSKNGYTFKGWKSSDGYIFNPGDNIFCYDDTVLTAVWEKSSYKLTYSANGGTGAPSSQEGVNLTISSIIPSRNGYTFEGWSTTADANYATYQPGGSISLSKDTTLYAIWKEKPIEAFTVTYNYSFNGGSSADKTSVTTTKGSVADLSVKAYKSNWVFVGWNTDKNAKTALSSYTVNSNTTLYAIYKRELNVHFIHGENKGKSTKTVVLYNNETSGTVTMYKPFSYSGWTTEGWRDDTAAGEKEYSSEQTITVSTNNVFYYAVYSKKITLSYDLNGGEGSLASQSLTQYLNAYGEKSNVLFVLKSEPERDGYIFKGWTFNRNDGNIYSSGETIAVTENTTLYAFWEQKNKVLPVQLEIETNKSHYILGVRVNELLETAKVVAVLYDSNKNVLDVTTEDFVIGGKTYLLLNKNADACTVKIFVWKKGANPATFAETSDVSGL